MRGSDAKGQQLHDSLNWEEDHVVQRKHREAEKKEETFQKNDHYHEKPWPLDEQLLSGSSVTEKTQKEIGHGNGSHVCSHRGEPTSSPPSLADSISPSNTPDQPPSKESEKLGRQAPKKSVEDRPDLETVQCRLRRLSEASKDKPLVVPRRSRRWSEGPGVVGDSKYRHRRSSLPLEPEISAQTRDKKVGAVGIDIDLLQCAERIVSSQRDKGAATSRESVLPVAHIVCKPSEEKPIVDVGGSSVATETPQSVEAREARTGASSRPLTPTECPETPGKWVQGSELQRKAPAVARTPSRARQRCATGRSKRPLSLGWWVGGRVR